MLLPPPWSPIGISRCVKFVSVLADNLEPVPTPVAGELSQELNLAHRLRFQLHRSAGPLNDTAGRDDHGIDGYFNASGFRKIYL